MERKVVAAQDVSRMCVVCGLENPIGLKARFLQLEDGQLLGAFAARREHQGYPDRLHGGLASAILDETIGRTISIDRPQVWGVTVELSLRFRRPVPLDGEVKAIARLISDDGRIFTGSGELLLPDGSVAVEGTGRYMKLPLERISAADLHEELRPDERPLPVTVDL